MDYDLVAPRFDPEEFKPRPPRPAGEAPSLAGRPEPPPPAPPPPEEAHEEEEPFSAEEVRRAFSGPIKPAPVTFGYRLSLALVGIAMLLLPAIYWAAAAGLGGALYWHATENLWLFDEVQSRSLRARVAMRVLRGLVYVVPLIAGGITLLLMIRPNMRRGGEEKPFVLEPGKEPALFALVEEICRRVRAPLPRRIIATLDVNAAAGLRLGFWSMFGRGDLDLRLGLPLAAGLTAQELAGLIAHEMGHFAQGAGMRLGGLIWMVTRWLGGVFGRFESYLKRREDPARFDPDADSTAELIGALIALFVWIVRTFVLALAALGDMASCMLARQKEYDADRYEVRIGGFKAYRQTSLKLRALAFGQAQAARLLNRSFRRGQLPDDIPALVLRSTQRMPPAKRKEIAHALMNSKTRWFDTHPSGRELLESAARENPEGVFNLEGPAARLFGDFEGLCKVLTYAHYKSVLGKMMTRDKLAPTELIEDDAPAFVDSAAAEPRSEAQR